MATESHDCRLLSAKSLDFQGFKKKDFGLDLSRTWLKQFSHDSDISGVYQLNARETSSKHSLLNIPLEICRSPCFPRCLVLFCLPEVIQEVQPGTLQYPSLEKYRFESIKYPMGTFSSMSRTKGPWEVIGYGIQRSQKDWAGFHQPKQSHIRIRIQDMVSANSDLPACLPSIGHICLGVRSKDRSPHITSLIEALPVDSLFADLGRPKRKRIPIGSECVSPNLCLKAATTWLPY